MCRARRPALAVERAPGRFAVDRDQPRSSRQGRRTPRRTGQSSPQRRPGRAAGTPARTCRGSGCRPPAARTDPRTPPSRARTPPCPHSSPRRTPSPLWRSAGSPTGHAAGHSRSADQPDRQSTPEIARMPPNLPETKAATHQAHTSTKRFTTFSCAIPLRREATGVAFGARTPTMSRKQGGGILAIPPGRRSS